MTITANDIKLLESERMADTSDGGGRRTSNVIPDGVAGNIFPKVSRLDSVYGRINLRKVYGAVQTANVDTYAGTHVVVTDPPDNDRIHIAVFSTASDYDNRTAARDRIESYVVAGPRSRMTLYGRQLVGQGAILVYQRTTEPLPEVGSVLCLSKEAGGTVTAQQFVRVTELATEIRTLTDGSGDFERMIITLELSSVLRYEFEGPETPPRVDQEPDDVVRTTTVADAATYYGIRPVSASAAQGALSINVDSVYSAIVPTTQRETAISNATTQGATALIMSSPMASPVRFYPFVYGPQDEYWSGQTTTLTTPTAVFPGSWSFANAADNSLGGIVINNQVRGSISYEAGVITLLNASDIPNNYVNVFWRPATNVSLPAHTEEIEVTLANRGTVYSKTLTPKPAAGSVIVDFRALGKWYRLRDNGLGSLSADDPNIGIGTVDYATGATVVTLGSLPDVDSSILYSWGSPIHFAITNDASTSARLSTTLENLPVKKASLTVTWQTNVSGNDVTRTATANAAGVITGTGVTGTIEVITGEVTLKFTDTLPNPGSILQFAYAQLTPVSPTAPVYKTGLFVPSASVTIPDAPFSPETFTFQVQASGSAAGMSYVTWSGQVKVQTLQDGTLIVAGGQLLSPNQSTTFFKQAVTQQTTIGVINNTTGQVTITNSTVQAMAQRYTGNLTGWVDQLVPVTIDQTTPTTYTVQSSSPATVDTARTKQIDLDETALLIDLTTNTGRSVVPGSVGFQLNNPRWNDQKQQYYDRNGSIVYSPKVTVGGQGLAAGSIDYNTGVVSLTYWYPGDSMVGFAVESCLTVYGEFTTTQAFFRTAGSPVRPGSTYVQATALDGTLISGTADENGTITAAKMRGEVRQEEGIVRVEFGEYISGTWTPISVFPSTLRYNTVVLSNLPLNADILGLDPVRLPSDGRVPIYRPADVVVIHNTKETTLTNPVVPGNTYSAGRTNLAELWLVDADGDRLAANLYTVNLTAGTVTIAADANLAAYTQPLKAQHRIEEMNLLSDVQVNGRLSLTGPLSRAYDADTYVSSALLFGDLNARATNLFDQQTWTDVWSDSRIGNGATATYNDIDYPVEVLNNGAVTERWRVNFTSATAFQLIGENLGVIATGTTSADLQPANSLTGQPYFTLRAAGWGSGWQAGNQLRFNTIGATAPIWIARTVLPGATLAGDSFDMQLRGDVDA